MKKKHAIISAVVLIALVAVGFRWWNGRNRKKIGESDILGRPVNVYTETIEATDLPFTAVVDAAAQAQEEAANGNG